MNTYIKVVILATILFLLPQPSYTFAPATHMYLGSQTYDVWSDFDSNFKVLLEQDSYWGHMTRKFYYIGLAIPDMIDKQEEIRGFLDQMIAANDHLNRALYIPDEVGENLDTMSFNGPVPNHNVEAMREMACWVRDNGSTSYERALVYGAYMHVIQDEFAHYELPIFPIVSPFCPQ